MDLPFPDFSSTRGAATAPPAQHHPSYTLQSSTLVAPRRCGHAREKHTKAGDAWQDIEPTLCQPAWRPGRSHLLHPWLQSPLRQVDDCTGKSQRPGSSLPWASCSLGKHSGKQVHATVLFRSKTLNQPHLCRARTHLMLQFSSSTSEHSAEQSPHAHPRCPRCRLTTGERRGIPRDGSEEKQHTPLAVPCGCSQLQCSARWTPLGSLQTGAQGDRETISKPNRHRTLQSAPPQTSALLPEAAWIQDEVPVKPFGMFSGKALLTIGNWGQLQHCVKGTFQVGHFICRESKAGGLSHTPSKSRLRQHLQQLRPAHTKDMHASRLLRASSIIPPPAGSILFPGTASSPAPLSRKYARRQRMTAW